MSIVVGYLRLAGYLNLTLDLIFFQNRNVPYYFEQYLLYHALESPYL